MDGLEVLQEISQTLLALLNEQRQISKDLEENNYLTRESIRTMSALIQELRSTSAAVTYPVYPSALYPPFPNTVLGEGKYSSEGYHKNDGTWVAPNTLPVTITYKSTSDGDKSGNSLTGILCETIKC